jgi:NADPH:quinone reductase-like Zn-dependent oxidoreductase
VRALTDGRGADLVYNTVGSPYFEAANRAMAIGARQVFIATVERAVPFDIFAFYRGQHTYVGVDSLALDCTACALILDRLAAGFASGALRPFPVAGDAVFGLDQALPAYREVLDGARRRIVIEP